MLDIEQIRVGWQKRGFSCDVWVDPPGQCWEDFVHVTDELVIVLEGRMEFEIEGVVYPGGRCSFRAQHWQDDCSLVVWLRPRAHIKYTFNREHKLTIQVYCRFSRPGPSNGE
ncbi:MAG: hypothetical protein Q9M24_06025 [Mariprofundaceae bacterium]|nr:hypothetical protein [Mariprofundaceae bacterium]